MKKYLQRRWNLWELTGIRHFQFRKPIVQKCPKFKTEKRNLHNQQWTFTNDKSGLAEIFNGESPFGDGEVEALDGLPEGFDIPQMPEAPQEYSPGLDKELKQKVESRYSDNSNFSKSPAIANRCKLLSHMCHTG